MILEIPVIPNPNRQIKIILNGQDCTIALYQKGSQLYLDLYVGTILITQGALCLNLVPIVQVAQNNFTGNLVLVDILGDTVPNHIGLNSRYFLMYYTDDEDLVKLTQTRLPA